MVSVTAPVLKMMGTSILELPSAWDSLWQGVPDKVSALTPLLLAATWSTFMEEQKPF